MRYSMRVLGLILLAAVGVGVAFSAPRPAPKDNANSVVITFRDGHRQSFDLSDVARIEVNGSPVAFTNDRSPDVDRSHFVGKWRVGDGAGGTFLITLSRDGEAKKTLGSGHGTWTVEHGEAVVSWDDGWHDVIRRSGRKYMKAAYSPGAPLSGDPSNTAEAIAAEAN